MHGSPSRGGAILRKIILRRKKLAIGIQDIGQWNRLPEEQNSAENLAHA